MLKDILIFAVIMIVWYLYLVHLPKAPSSNSHEIYSGGYTPDHFHDYYRNYHCDRLDPNYPCFEDTLRHIRDPFNLREIWHIPGYFAL